MPDIIGNWIVTEAEGITVREGQMRFEISDGSVFGQAPCNSFSADLSTENGQFSLGRISKRSQSCDPDIMADEHEYMRMLKRLSDYKIEADGALVLLSFGTPAIRAVRED